ncbi:MAG: hypothetical protein ABSD10_00770 [Candidatus Saccharimonadales bacterium]|jgi:hypothetical protein
MSSFEAHSHEPWENQNINIIVVPLPREVDDDWCALFAEAYGAKGLRAVTVAWGYRQQRHGFRCQPQRDGKSFDWKNVPPKFTDTGAVFDGEVVAARMVPEWSELYVMYLVMRDVSELSSEWRPAPPGEELWIPIYKTDDELLLHQKSFSQQSRPD